MFRSAGRAKDLSASVYKTACTNGLPDNEHKLLEKENFMKRPVYLLHVSVYTRNIFWYVNTKFYIRKIGNTKQAPLVTNIITYGNTDKESYEYNNKFRMMHKISS
jgi:hypothetical protein